MKKVLLGIMLPVILLSFSHLSAGQAAPPSLNDQLIAAAGNGDVAAVEQLLAQGANIEYKDHAGWTTLIHAARQRRNRDGEVAVG